ncbi:MAG: DUF4097 family beta strand repeat protein [Xanthomonadaceae bacterium]|nr:DUF4097 family beta strand repeat protein [Xanthomonadaceae bacterium]MDE1885292.1 DUF4097 family beta strand repeat protein [Xanthomonadaceae bacterium]MDE1960274.1 DUF4097 family beta strand repeat protein [Xanthomonadaceae bacterium]MDE2084511.1 DUF4097 family beta strand repeat protein [Xanthomonadaceae bacterium]
MKISFVHIATLCILLAATGSAPAGAPAATYSDISAGDAAKPLDSAWPIAADGRIDVANVRGKVTIAGWDLPQVKLEGTLGAGSTLAVSGGAERLTLRVKSAASGWFGSNGPRHDSVLILHVPRTAALDVNVVSADASVTDMSGKSLKAGSVSGNLDLSSTAPALDVDSVSGDVKLDAPSPNPSAQTHVQTVSGDIRAQNLAGRIKLETVSGSMDCACAAVRELDTGSVSGDADITVTPAASARLHLESMSGSIRLHLPVALSAHIDASTFSGSIHSDFGTVQEKQYGPGSSLKAQIGGGDADISVQSFSGDIQLRKQ